MAFEVITANGTSTTHANVLTKINENFAKAVEKETGKGLSEENFTTEQSEILATVSQKQDRQLYYISSTGTGNGYFPGVPMSTEDLADILPTFPEGARLRFKRGDIFDNISIEAIEGLQVDYYGVGLKPIFRGSVSIGSNTWTSEGANIYSTILTQAPKWIYVNGVEQKLAQTDWIPITARTSTTQLSASSATLNALGNIVGAGVIVKEFDFRTAVEVKATAYSSGVITTSGTIGSSVSAPGINMPFKLTGLKQFITENGEWCYEESTQKLYFMSATTPAGTDIRASIQDYAFVIDDVENVSIKNITIQEYYKGAVFGDHAHGLKVDNVQIQNCRLTGIYLPTESDGFSFTNLTIKNIGVNALIVRGGKNGAIKDNTITDIGMEATFPYLPDTSVINAQGMGILFSWDSTSTIREPENCLIENNYLYNIGYVGIHLCGNRNKLIHNIIDTYSTKLNDAGAIHCIHRASVGTSTTGNLIAKNIIRNGIGNVDGIVSPPNIYAEGIYLDNGCYGNTVDSNLVYNIPDFGILCNWDTKENTITNNLTKNCLVGIGFREYAQVSQSPVWLNNTGNICKGNIMVSQSATQRGMLVYSFDNNTNFNPFSAGSGIDLNYYVSPYASYVAKHNSTDYTMAGWRTKLTGDANSRDVTNTLTYTSANNAANELLLEVNDSLYSKHIIAKNNSFDIDNQSIKRANVAARSGVLFINGTPIVYLLRDTFTDTNGTAIGSHTLDSGGNWTVASGTHAITNGYFTTSVDGLVRKELTSNNFDATILGEITTTGGVLSFQARFSLDAANRVTVTFTENTLTIANVAASVSTSLYTGAVTIALNTPVTIRIYLVGTTLRVYLNGVQQYQKTDMPANANNWFVIAGKTTSKIDSIFIV